MNHSLQEQAISRGLRGTRRQEELPATHDRILFFRNPSNPHEIKVIHRIWNPYTQDYTNKIDSNFHVAEPPEGAKETSKFLVQQLMRMHEPTPFRYGNK